MKEDRITFRSGRYIEPNNGIVGLSPGLELYDGYDETLKASDPAEHDDPFPQELSPAEEVELADIMIARWSQVRAAALVKAER